MGLNRTGRALNKNEKILIGALAVVALGYLTYTFIIEPSNKKLKPIETRVETLKDQVENIDSLQVIITGKQKELDGLKEKYEEASKTIPKTDRYPQVVKDIERMATESGVTISSGKYDAPKTFTSEENAETTQSQDIGEEGLTYISLGLQLSGSYNQILNFVKALEGDTRILEVSSLAISKTGGSINVIYYIAGGAQESEEYDFNTGSYGKDNLFE